jgi:hypothetical protein
MNVKHKIVVALEKSHQKQGRASKTTKRKSYKAVFMSLTAHAILQAVTQQNSS